MFILKIYSVYQQLQQALRRYLALPGALVPLLLRLYLAPVLAQAGWQKYQHFANTVPGLATPTGAWVYPGLN